MKPAKTADAFSAMRDFFDVQKTARQIAWLFFVR